MRARIGTLLRRVANRLDPSGEPRPSGLSFTYENGIGMVLHGELGCHRATTKGRTLWLLDADEGRAWSDADDRPPRVLWKNLSEGRRPFVDYGEAS